MTFWCRGVCGRARARHQPGRLVPWLPAPHEPRRRSPTSASSPVPLTRMIWLKRKFRATPAARNHPVSRMLRVNGAPGAGEQGWRGGRTQVRGRQAPVRQSPAARAGAPGSQAPGSLVAGSLAGPVRHEPQTRCRTTHIRRLRHISAVDPGYVVDPVHSRPPDQPQDPDQPR